MKYEKVLYDQMVTSKDSFFTEGFLVGDDKPVISPVLLLSVVDSMTENYYDIINTLRNKLFSRIFVYDMMVNIAIILLGEPYYY